MNSKTKTILLAAVLSFSARGAEYSYVEGERVTVKRCNTVGVCQVVFEDGGETSSEALPGFVEMVRFETGSFTMGSLEDEKGRERDEGQVEVTLNRAFEIGKYEVTQRQWFGVMDANPSYFSKNKYCPEDYTEMTNAQGERVGLCPEHPVETVSWSDTQEFFRRLNRRDGNTGCEGNPRKKGCWRLPTEAEWEYAARAGTETRYSFGDDEHELDDYGWYLNNSDKQTHRVGMKKANLEGLHDMHGNVWEWTMDDYGKKLPGGDDPLQIVWEQLQVVRGGGWGGGVRGLRSAHRSSGWGGRISDLGIRAVRTL